MKIKKITKIKKPDIQKIKSNVPKTETYEDLIHNDYLDFTNKQEKEYEVWTPCQTKVFKHKFLKKEYQYPDSSSNQQISTFLKKISKKRKKYFQLNRFYVLLTNFVSNQYASKLLNILSKNPNITDREFINLLQNASPKDKTPMKYLSNNYFNNNSDICPEKLYMFQNIYLDFKKIFKKIYQIPMNEKNIKKLNYRYLDIGCGSGTKTIEVAKQFHIPKTMVYGTDIYSWGPYLSNKDFPFSFKYILENGKLDFPDNYFGFVSCFLTLHHVPNLTLLLQEIKRVLIPNGLLLIIEHDVTDMYDGFIIDIQHMLYSYMYDSYKNPKEYKNYIENPLYSRYFSTNEWDYVLYKNKFYFEYANVLYTSISYELNYDNQFVAIYKNEK
jgi:ubiquinone/menaquinone biosynthesis C-methylase UbiE